MKLLILVAVCVALSAASVIPVSRDNSQYEEGRYFWMPDGEGQPRLVDLQEPVDQARLSARNGANNVYWLFTRQNPTNRQILVNGNANSIRNSNYRSTRPTKVVVHGWGGSGHSEMNSMIRDAFLEVLDCNVIVVDWHALADEIYPTAAAGVPNVGQFLGNFLIWLLHNGGGQWNQVHIVGFSLGAHIAHVAGRQASGNPARITGLDPAGPGWSGNRNRLQSNSARYVEAIHTNGAVAGAGINIPSGHADFYPNGGQSQPGCILPSCSHSRAYEFFAATVRFNRLVGNQCADLQQANNNRCSGARLNMGNHILSKSGRGLYAMTTGRNWPF